jgi:flagellar basal body-associated protein FliL
MAEKKEKVKGKGNGLKIIIIVLLVIIIFGLGFGGYMLFLKKNETESTNTTHLNTNAAAQNTASNLNNLNVAYEVSAYTYTMEEFLVNLSDDGGKRFLKVNLFLGYDTKKKKEMDKELEEKMPILRDAIISILRSKKTTDLVSKENLDALKKEVIARINPYFEYGKVTNIYFKDFLIQ